MSISLSVNILQLRLNPDYSWLNSVPMEGAEGQRHKGESAEKFLYDTFLKKLYWQNNFSCEPQRNALKLKCKMPFVDYRNSAAGCPCACKDVT